MKDILSPPTESYESLQGYILILTGLLA